MITIKRLAFQVIHLIDAFIKNTFSFIFLLHVKRFLFIDIVIRHRAHPDEQQRARLKGGKKDEEVNHRGKI